MIFLDLDLAGGRGYSSVLCIQDSLASRGLGVTAYGDLGRNDQGSKLQGACTYSSGSRETKKIGKGVNLTIDSPTFPSHARRIPSCARGELDVDLFQRKKNLREFR